MSNVSPNLALTLMRKGYMEGANSLDQLEELVAAGGDPENTDPDLYVPANAEYHLRVLKSMARMGVDLEFEIEALEHFVAEHQVFDRSVR